MWYKIYNVCLIYIHNIHIYYIYTNIICFVTATALRQLMLLGTWYTVAPKCIKSYHCGDNREGTLFSWLHIRYAHLTSVRFENSVYRGQSSPLIYIIILISINFSFGLIWTKSVKNNKITQKRQKPYEIV